MTFVRIYSFFFPESSNCPFYRDRFQNDRIISVRLLFRKEIWFSGGIGSFFALQFRYNRKGILFLPNQVPDFLEAFHSKEVLGHHPTKWG